MIRRSDSSRTAFGESLKKYIQSYLGWMFKQNSYMAESLTNDELVNYLFHQIDLPVWFQILQRRQPWDLLTTTHRLIACFKNEAGTYPVLMIVEPLSECKGMVQVKSQDESASHVQIVQLQSICNEWGLSLPKHVSRLDYVLTTRLTERR